MELIDNVNKTLKDDLTVSIQKDSKISIAAACFSIYAFQELKRELKNVDELRFIFTSPTFIKENAKKEKIISEVTGIAEVTTEGWLHIKLNTLLPNCRYKTNGYI